MAIDISAPIPLPVRLLALVVASLAMFGGGYVKGLLDGSEKMHNFVNDVKVVGAKQQVKLDVVAQQGATISKESGESYEKSSKRLRDLYGPGRVLRNGSGGNQTTSIPEPSGQLNVEPADLGFGSGIRAPEEDVCRPLKADAAQTTLQLLKLQDWVWRQQQNWDGTVLE